MVEIDWETFNSLEPETLSEREKENLYDTVTWYSGDFDIEKKYLKQFARVSQEILKYKGEQVSLLTSELDELAAKQGKEEGSKLQEYIEEIEQLKEELEYNKKLDRSSSRSPYASSEELQRELVKLEMQNEELLKELSEKEKELLNEKEEVEKYAAQVGNLEREKLELSRELRALQDEAADKRFKSLKDSPEINAEKHELTEVIRQKNHHISQLLEDMEVIEEENISLRTKLTCVRDELAETTTHITEITTELTKLKHLNEEYETKNVNLEEMIKSLQYQVEELVEEKSKQNQQLDEYIQMFNSKLQEWKDELEIKDEETIKLKEELKKISSPRVFTSDSNDTKIIQLEKEIQVLQEELAKATEEINSSTELIEKLQEKQFQSVSAPVHCQSIKFFEEKIKVLEEKLTYAEEDALAKAEEMSELVIQLREYESGVFGLSEAITKIKKLEKNIQKKDLQIEKLVEICNNLEIQLDNLEDQNLCLRERLGLTASDVVDTSGVELKYKKDEELLSRLKFQLDQKEEELIKVKMKYRKVIKFLKLHPLSQTTGTADPKQDALIKENDALRKGMHEILESVRNSSGSVEVQSECLERLLEALDARHISGWYHPAMRLQAQLSTEEGKNEELRNQIRNLRWEEKKITNELQNAYRKIESLELESTPRYEAPEELENELRELKLELKKNKTEMEELEKNFSKEKENLLNKISELENNQPKMENLEKLSESSKVLVQLMTSLEQTQREMMKQEENYTKEILKLQNDKRKLSTTIQQLQNDLLNSVSKEKHESLIKELNCFKTKYQTTISLALAGEKQTNDDFRAEVELLEKEKQELVEELKSTKTKLIATEVLVREESVTKDFSAEISNLATKLASSETREVNERQKWTHVEKMNEILKTQQRETETRNEELQMQVSKLSEELVKRREREKQLEMKFLRQVAEEEWECLKQKAECLEKKCEELTTERDNIQELFEISQGQFRALQEWKDGDKILLAAANEQILILQSSDEDKEKMSRLSHELAMTKLTTSQLTKKNNDLKMKITKLHTRNLSLELKIEENDRELFVERKKHQKMMEHLLQSIDEIRETYSGMVPLKDAEFVYQTKKQLLEKRKEIDEKTKQLKTQIHKYETEKEKMELQLESVEDLKAGLKGDAKNLIAWHNRTTELRLKETKTRRENEFLKGEITQLENCVRKLNEEITALEEESIQREKEWERKQVVWEKTQLQLLGGKKRRVNDAWTNTREVAPRNKVEVQEPKIDKESKTVPEQEETEKEALRMTVQSFQGIIKQKEETIVRYQELLKEGREEYSKACGKLQEELRNLNEALTNQTKAYNKLKNSVQEKQMMSESVPEVVEKYVTKIHELEEELREAEMSLSSVSAEIRRKEDEAEKYRKLAEEKESALEEIKKRLENDQKSIDENHEQELRKHRREIERLTEFIDLLRTENLKPTATDEKPKFKEPIQQNSIERSDQLSDCTFDKPRKQNKVTREVETLQKQLKFAKEESGRLREQIRLLQAKPQRRPKTTESGKEESLTGKIKNLEELLTMSKEREKELMDVNQKKLKSVEEVARWEERKKSQHTIQTLTGKLKEKEAELEVLRSKNESFRNLIYKCERDKAVLESQLKSVRDGPGGLNSKIEKLTIEKQQLETEIVSLRTKLEEQIRHSSGLGAVLLEEKLEEQERKLASYELASKGQNALMEELERIKMANSNLEKINLKLESENLSLQLKLEKERAETKYLVEKAKCEDGSAEVRRQETACHHQKIMDKLKEENRRLKSNRKESRSCDLARVKEEHGELKAKYLEAVNRNAGLESELKSVRYQLHLMEEKDLAEALARTTSFQTNAELSQELIEVKAKLAHKNELMTKVKSLLAKAAAKEKALIQQVAALQSLLPKPLDSCC